MLRIHLVDAKRVETYMRVGCSNRNKKILLLQLKDGKNLCFVLTRSCLDYKLFVIEYKLISFVVFWYEIVSDASINDSKLGTKIKFYADDGIVQFILCNSSFKDICVIFLVETVQKIGGGFFF